MNQFGFDMLNRSYVSTSQYYSFGKKMLRYKDKLIYYSASLAPYILLQGPVFLNSTAVPSYTRKAMSYIIVTDTLGNLINYFKPAELYDTLSQKYIGNQINVRPDYLPNLTIDKSGDLYFEWSINDNDNGFYKTNGYNRFNLNVRLNDNTMVKKSDPFSLIVKYDLNGNVIWHKEINYLKTTSIVANNDGNIYGLGRYYKLSEFESTDGNNQLITTNDSCHRAIFYSYDNSGNFLWGKPFVSNMNGYQYPYDLSLRDSCNTNVYFSTNFDTTATFMGNNYPYSIKTKIFNYSPDGSCSFIDCTPVTTTTTVPSGIETISNNNNESFVVIPNPNNGQFTLLLTSKEATKIEVQNSLSQTVFIKELSSDRNNIVFDVIESGVYYVIVTGKSFKQTKKILVIR